MDMRACMRSDLLANVDIGRRAWNERTNLRHGQDPQSHQALECTLTCNPLSSRRKRACASRW